MGFFPFFMEVAIKKCMIFGGGKVALRKIETLSAFDADMEVVSGHIAEEILRYIPEEKIHRMDILFEEMAGKSKESSMEFWLSQADFVIAATSQRKINNEIAKWCHRNNIPVNVIDSPEDCTFLFPSVVKRGEISIGINTGGKSPIVSKKVRKGIQEAIPEYYGEIADQLGLLREYVKNHFPEEKDRRQILKTVAAEAFLKERALTEEEVKAILEESGD